MWKEYKETFDGVHASQRLKAEVLNMKREENATKRRRIPAALAAALVLVLAGTAVAALEYRGRVSIAPIEDSYENGYILQGDIPSIPAQRLSREVLDCAAQAGKESDTWTFDSWSEAETFLGLKVGDNPVLDRMAEWIPPYAPDLTPEELRSCTVIMSSSAGLPNMIDMRASYFREDTNFYFLARAVILVEGPWGGDRSYNASTPIDRGAIVEEYVTANGLDVTIVDSDRTISRPDGSSFEAQTYTAYFILDDALFSVETAVVGDSNPLDSLKEVLDAYE